MKPFFYRGRFVFIPLAIVAFLSLISFVVMQLWNHLLPDILHVGTITFWQAMGVFVLSKILFGFGKGRGFKGGYGHHPFANEKMNRFKERMRDMSPEEREQFKQKFKERMCDFRGRDGRRGRGFGFDWDDFATDESKKATE